MDENLLLSTGANKTTLCQKIVHKLDTIVEKEQIVKLSVQQCVLEQNLQFMRWLNEIRGIKKFSVEKEIQLNDWFTDCMEEELCHLQFQTRRQFSHNNFSIFGKSRPEFAFIKTMMDG